MEGMVGAVLLDNHLSLLRFCLKISAWTTLAYMAIYGLRAMGRPVKDISLGHCIMFLTETAGMLMYCYLMYEWGADGYKFRLAIEEEMVFLTGCTASLWVVVPHWKNLVLKAWNP